MLNSDHQDTDQIDTNQILILQCWFRFG